MFPVKMVIFHSYVSLLEGEIEPSWNGELDASASRTSWGVKRPAESSEQRPVIPSCSTAKVDAMFKGFIFQISLDPENI
jgi:hypothetical protein